LNAGKFSEEAETIKPINNRPLKYYMDLNMHQILCVSVIISVFGANHILKCIISVAICFTCFIYGTTEMKPRVT